MNVQGDQAPPNRQKMLKKIPEFIHKDHYRTIHELTDTIGISHGVCQILTENLNMFKHVS
jgi:hypothetical protein